MNTRDPLGRQLAAWQAEIDTVPWPELVTVDQVIAIVTRVARHRTLRHRCLSHLRRGCRNLPDPRSTERSPRRSPRITSSSPRHGDRAVSDGLARLHPQLELMRLDEQRTALMREYLVPPAEKILPIAERQLQLWQQLGAAGHDVADVVDRLAAQITDLQASVAPVTSSKHDPATSAS